MPTYTYKARDKFGKLIQGVMSADSESAIASKLKQSEQIPVSIEISGGKPLLQDLLKAPQPIRFTDVNIFTRQFYTLQKAGLPVLASLSALSEQATNVSFKKIIGQIRKDIEEGSLLSDALAKHPKVFNALYSNMVKSGEASGRLPDILERLASLGEHEEKVRLQIKAATRYPLIVIASVIVGFLILVAFVIPRFVKVYAKFDTPLPVPTKMLIWMHHFVTGYWWALILFVVGLALILPKVFSTQKGAKWLDKFKLKIPIFGELFLKLNMTRFCRITGVLMQSGVPIIQILDLVSEGTGNSVISKVVEDIKKSVNAGDGMIEPMKESGLFPAVVTQMISVGEQTGRLDELLLYCSDYYDSEIDYTIQNLVSLIEPILIFLLGIVVLFMAFGIFLPMWNMMNLFGG